jgi:hypothetical protein
MKVKLSLKGENPKTSKRSLWLKKSPKNESETNSTVKSVLFEFESLSKRTKSFDDKEIDQLSDNTNSNDKQSKSKSSSSSRNIIINRKNINIEGIKHIVDTSGKTKKEIRHLTEKYSKPTIIHTGELQNWLKQRIGKKTYCKHQQNIVRRLNKAITIASEAAEIKKADRENERALVFQHFYNQIYNLTDFKTWAKNTIRHSKSTTLTNQPSAWCSPNIYNNLNEITDNCSNNTVGVTLEYSPLQLNTSYKRKSMSNGSKTASGGGVQEMDLHRGSRAGEAGCSD